MSPGVVLSEIVAQHVLEIVDLEMLQTFLEAPRQQGFVIDVYFVAFRVDGGRVRQVGAERGRGHELHQFSVRHLAETLIILTIIA